MATALLSSGCYIDSDHRFLKQQAQVETLFSKYQGVGVNR